MHKKIPQVGYPGGKIRLAKTICGFLPQSGRFYCEPFAGRGNVFWRAQSMLNYQGWWLNDIRTTPWFEAVKEIGDRIVVPGRISAEEYERQGQLADQGDLEAIVLEPWHSFSGGGYKHYGRRVREIGGPTAAGFTKTLRAAFEILNTKPVKFSSLQYWQVLASLTADDTAYIDPPYYNAAVQSYDADDIDFGQLVSVLKKAKCRWILSEYEQPFYNAAFGEPFFRKAVRFLNSAPTVVNNPMKVECLWKNF